jgi:hypothetical protein
MASILLMEIIIECKWEENWCWNFELTSGFCTGRATHIGWSKTLQVATSQFLHCGSWVWWVITVWWVWVWLQWVTSICHINMSHCVTPSHVQAHCLIPLPKRCYHKSTNETTQAESLCTTVYLTVATDCPYRLQIFRMSRWEYAGVCWPFHLSPITFNHTPVFPICRAWGQKHQVWFCDVWWTFNVHGCWRRWNNGSKSEMQAHSWSEWSLLLLFL